jgi:hypothetical protein
MVTRLSGGLTPGDGADPRTFPAIWNVTAETIESQGTAISGLEGKNIPAFGTAAPSDAQVLAFGTAASEFAPVTLDLDYLSDVSIGTAVSDGQVLAYSTAVSGWVNEDSAVGGKILQVVSTTKTDTFSTSLSAGSFASVTGLSATITPTSSSSKILIFASVNAASTADGSQANSVWRLTRGGTAIGVGDAAGSRQQLTSAHVVFGIDNTSQQSRTSAEFLDSPATTSATTYAIQLANSVGSGTTQTVYVNRSEGDADTANTGGRPVSSITLMEVAV